ncbi:MAG: patatin-like phospholipase family protein [Chitinophagaceae bacterium]|nr:patatin-like phospholipase family protein [Rubrivivax sp.]
MSVASERDEWLTRVFGVQFPPTGEERATAPSSTAPGDGAAKVSAKVSMAPPGPPANFIAAGDKAPPAGQVQPGIKPVSTQQVTGAGGKPMSVIRTADGKVVLKAPPAPIEQVTFSGGGGKGAAYPGAIHALEDSGVLKTLKVVTGASVGSMTAALIAAGMTADEFEKVGNDPAVAGQIKEGHGLLEAVAGGGISGEGMQALVRKKMTGAVGQRVAEYIAAQQKAGLPIDPRVLQVGKKLAGGQKGPTFGDLRTLSQVIPAIKEVVISGTLMGTVEPKTMLDMVKESIGDGLVDVTKLIPGVGTLANLQNTAERNMGNDQPDPNKLVPEPRPMPYVFSADTEPDLEVALAVRASAAFPGVFKPVDIPLKNGKTGRFKDGGVLNNAPTLRSVGMERTVDPVPQKRNLTFLFGDEISNEIVKGNAPLPTDRAPDLFTGADNNAAEYWKNLDLARHREEVVALPMTFTNDQDELVDASGLGGGTLNFDMPLQDKRTLQAQAKTATNAKLAAEGEAKDCPFASVEEMLTCIPRADLAAMAADGFEGAAEALEFRDKVTETVGRMLARTQALSGRGAPSAMARDAEVVNAFERLESLAEGSKPRQAFVAREINRNPRLDDLMTAMHGKRGAGDALKASLAMNDAMQLQDRVKALLREVLIPKRVHEDADSVGGELLKQVQGQLLKVKSAAQANALLMHMIEYYEKPLPMPPASLFMPAPPKIPRDKPFADALRARLLKA